MVKGAAKRVKTTENTDGGATAIGGFVFQILAGTTDQITAETFGGTTPYSDAVIYLHEAFNQDVAEKLSDKVKLIQVKYSADGTNKKISPGELDEVTNRLQKAAKSATREGLQVTGFKLLSNRGLSDLAEKKLIKGRKDKAAAKVTDLTKKGVLAKLKTPTLGEPEMKRRLHKFGASFGLRPTEIKERIELLTGKIFNEVARKKVHAMSLADVREVFAGNKDAKALTRPSMNAQLGAELGKLASGVEGNHIPRSQAARVLAQNPNRALFVFLGDGGMGKTASLHHLMAEELGAPAGPLLRAGRGADIPLKWAESCVDDWRGTPLSPLVSLRDSYERLRIANPKNGPPILTLALDGIDEGVKELHEDDIRTLIRDLATIDRESRAALSSEPPEIRLIVTCREKQELTRFLSGDISGFGTEDGEDFQPLEFGPFTPDEFWQAVNADQPLLLDKIFQSSSRVAGLSAYSLGGVPAMAAAPPIFKGLEYLQDPLIWRAFTALDDTEKNQVLQLDPRGEKPLGAKLLARFCTKTEARCKWNPDKKLGTVLQAVAGELRTNKKGHNRGNFLEATSRLGGLSANEADRLFREALNGGLIRGGNIAWEWRHRIIERALEL